MGGFRLWITLAPDDVVSRVELAKTTFLCQCYGLGRETTNLVNVVVNEEGQRLTFLGTHLDTHEGSTSCHIRKPADTIDPLLEPFLIKAGVQKRPGIIYESRFQLIPGGGSSLVRIEELLERLPLLARPS